MQQLHSERNLYKSSIIFLSVFYKVMMIMMNAPDDIPNRPQVLVVNDDDEIINEY